MKLLKPKQFKAYRGQFEFVIDIIDDRGKYHSEYCDADEESKFINRVAYLEKIGYERVDKFKEH